MIVILSVYPRVMPQLGLASNQRVMCRQCSLKVKPVAAMNIGVYDSEARNG